MSVRNSQHNAANGLQIAAWAAVTVLVLWLSLRGYGLFQLGVFQDDATYAVLARSIAFGDQYGLVDAPGPPPPSKFGFGFPLSLAPIVRLDPNDFSAPTIVPLLATLINVSLLFWGWPWLSPRGSRWWGLAVASLYGVSPVTIGHTRILLSEPLFTTFVLTSLILTEACERPRRRGWIPVALGVGLALALFTRPIGIALWGAAFLRLGLRRRFADVVALLLGAVAIVSLVVALTSVSLRDLPPWEYANEMQRVPKQLRLEHKVGFIARRVFVVQGYALYELRPAILPFGGGDRERDFGRRFGTDHLPEITSALVTATVLLGAWRSIALAALSPAALLFEAIYAAGLVSWPWFTARFLYPIQPLLMFQFFLGVIWLASWSPARRSRDGLPRFAAVVTSAIWVLLFAISLAKSLPLIDSRKFSRDLRVGSTWLADHIDGNAIVATRDPHAVYLYTGRKTVDLFFLPEAAAIGSFLESNRADYLMLAPQLLWSSDRTLAYSDVDQDMLPILADMASRGQVELVYQSGAPENVLVYRIHRS